MKWKVDQRMLIILTGFMGVGKTTVGRILANKLGVPFVDMDYYIEARQGQTIAEIFDQIGESGFRLIEYQVLRELLEAEENGRMVISTGGGIVETTECRQLLVQQDQVFYLQDTFETSWQRINRGGLIQNDRPLVNANSKKQMAAKYERRIPLYEEASNYRLDVRRMVAHETAEVIRKMC